MSAPPELAREREEHAIDTEPTQKTLVAKEDIQASPADAGEQVRIGVFLPPARRSGANPRAPRWPGETAL